MTTDTMIRIALIEDDSGYRDAVRELLESTGRFTVAGAFARAELAFPAFERTPVELALVDVNLPGQPGPAAVRTLREQWPRMHCVMLTMMDDADNLFAALQAGATGYLLKSATPEEILAGIDEALAGGAPMSRSIARRVLAAFIRPAAARESSSDLTAREREIMERLSGGLADKEIAAALGVSKATVKNHLYRIYEKLAVRSRTEAVVKWLGR